MADRYEITLIDKDLKQGNDRTWCFWEKGKGFFEEVVYCRWKHLNFYSREFHSTLSIDPYEYKMIRSADLYRYCLDRINNHPNIRFIQGEIIETNVAGPEISVRLADGSELRFENAIGFNSVPQVSEPRPGDIRLLQHFKGWVIETDYPVFDPQKATLMDFRISQDAGTSFVYVLPVSEKRALVEFTVFSEHLLSEDDYARALREYCSSYLKLSGYKIAEEEFGVIPMDNLRYPAVRDGFIQIGTAGGQTKASSGYTFQNIQKHSAQMVDLLEKGKLPLVSPAARRFRFYDHTLLHILKHRQYPGDRIFSILFKKNPPQRVLRFLDNESGFGEEIKLLWSLPAWPFLKAALQKRRTY